jgi:hypothetical protein
VGLFGDKDLKRLDEEILAMKMALEMSDLSSSNPALEKGLAEGGRGPAVVATGRSG